MPTGRLASKPTKQRQRFPSFALPSSAVLLCQTAQLVRQAVYDQWRQPHRAIPGWRTVGQPRVKASRLIGRAFSQKPDTPHRYAGVKGVRTSTLQAVGTGTDSSGMAIVNEKQAVLDQEGGELGDAFKNAPLARSQSEQIPRRHRKLPFESRTWRCEHCVFEIDRAKWGHQSGKLSDNCRRLDGGSLPRLPAPMPPMKLEVNSNAHLSLLRKFYVAEDFSAEPLTVGANSCGGTANPEVGQVARTGGTTPESAAKTPAPGCFRGEDSFESNPKSCSQPAPCFGEVKVCLRQLPKNSFVGSFTPTTLHLNCELKNRIAFYACD